ncbi:winged helix-turn-helix domain-containing protein [Gynuella sunshinyii]|uniref:DNA-binding winged-HTH domain n=1 Tax=Gynuella sunshinyii YC6258 TaxID=1445510 RepID=A0A0C5VFT9_9GAMM|nr:winged helix-turn-helix domain-containing protein [Gynuella sunshinyii]AJQ93457.1 DNA-binding winged-HTH domain [Gynuella sunshinyii YC6258]
MNDHPFFIGEWQVSPKTNTIRRGETVRQLEPRVMDVLVALSSQKGQPLSADEIVQQCWGNTEIGDNPVHKAINQLRRALGDKPSEPLYVETIRKRGYRIVAELSFPASETVTELWQNKSPFPGLRAFSSGDAAVFFGRNEQIVTLLQQLSGQVSNGHTFCLILGPSGSGKSSLLNAGVIPALEDRKGYDGIGVLSHTSLDFADIGKHQLFMDLAAAMLDWEIDGTPLFEGCSAETLVTMITEQIDEVIDICRQRIAVTETSYAHPQLSLFIDRLEVLLSSPLFSTEERDQFLNIIDYLARSGCILIFSACRNDFYPLIVGHPILMAVKASGAVFDLMPPTRLELMQMIRLPATAAGLAWARDPVTQMPLDEILCADASGHPDSLPMLQYTLEALYQQRSSDDELLVSVYQQLGGIEGAIGRKAEEIFLSLPANHQAALSGILPMLLTMTDDGKSITSRTAAWAQLQHPDQIELVQALIDHRLLVSHLYHDEPCFSVCHEALWQHWPRVQTWIRDHRDSLAVKTRLQQQAQRWQQEQRSQDFLLAQGKPLQEAQELQEQNLFVLDVSERELIKASARRAEFRHWLNRAVIALLCTLTLTSVFMSIRSHQAETLARQKRLEAENLLGFMVGEFADKLRSVKRMDLLDGISNEALAYFSSLEQQSNQDTFLPFLKNDLSFKSMFHQAQTLGAIGEVAYSRDRTDEARQAFEAASSVLQRLVQQQKDNLDLLKESGANAFWLGQLEYDDWNLDAALVWFDTYRNYSERMYALAPDSLDAILELSDAHSTMGSLYLEQQNYPAAQTAFQSSLSYTRQAIQMEPDDETLHMNQADTLSWLGSVAKHLGDLQQAIELNLNGQQELEKALEREPDNANIIESLAYSYTQQARMLHYRTEYHQASDKVDQAITMMEKGLIQDPENSGWQDYLLGLKAFQRLLQANKGHPDDADLTAMIEASMGHILENAAIDPSTLIDTIQYYQVKRDWSKSKVLIEQAETQLDVAQSTDTFSSYALQALAELKLMRARLDDQNQNGEHKRQACQAAVELLQPLLEKSRSAEYLMPFVQAHDCLGQQSMIQNEVAALRQMGISDVSFMLVSGAQ